jgi:hypothetical protein
MTKGQLVMLAIGAFLVFKAAASPVEFDAALSAVAAWLVS